MLLSRTPAVISPSREGGNHTRCLCLFSRARSSGYVSCRYLLRRRQFGNLDTCARASPGLAGELKLILIAVNDRQALTDVRQADAARHWLVEPLEHEPHPVVLDFDDGPTMFAPAAKRDDPGAD